MISYFQSDNSSAGNFVNPQWIITPLPNNKWCLVLSGVLICNFTTGTGSGWRRDTLQIGLDINSIFSFAGFDSANKIVTLQVEQYACYGSLNSIFDKDESVNAGFAVDKFYPFFAGGGRALTDGSGVFLDVATQDIDATLLRVGYYLMAIGTISSAPIPPIQ
ncbi:MAG TPA: hypothetical protein VKR53_07465 [Puia sp.]|nr:hypothetical protein [Puia sp.]